MRINGPDRWAERGGALLSVGLGGRWALATTTQAWVFRERSVEATLTTPGDPFVGLGFSREGNLLLAAPHRYDLARANWSPSVDYSDAPTRRGAFVVRAAVWDATGADLLVASEYRGARGRDEPKGRLLRVNDHGREALSERDLRAVAFTDGGDALAAADDLSMWDARGRFLGAADLAHGSARAIAVEGSRAAVAMFDGGLAVVSLEGPSLKKAWRAHADTTAGVAWVAGHVVSAGFGGEVRVWDTDGRLCAEARPRRSRTPRPLYALAAGGGRTVLVSVGGPEPAVLAYEIDGL